MTDMIAETILVVVIASIVGAILIIINGVADCDKNIGNLKKRVEKLEKQIKQ